MIVIFFHVPQEKDKNGNVITLQYNFVYYVLLFYFLIVSNMFYVFNWTKSLLRLCFIPLVLNQNVGKMDI